MSFTLKIVFILFFDKSARLVSLTSLIEINLQMNVIKEDLLSCIVVKVKKRKRGMASKRLEPKNQLKHAQGVGSMGYFQSFKKTGLK